MYIDGLWDLINAHVDNKVSNGVTRIKGYTIMTPAAREKKDERIAMRDVQRAAQGIGGEDEEEEYEEN